MTRKEFDRLTRQIETETFVSRSLDPITLGVERAKFEQDRYRRLIDLAAKANTWKTVKMKELVWKRQLERAQKAQARFEGLQQTPATRSRTPDPSAPDSKEGEMHFDGP